MQSIFNITVFSNPHFLMDSCENGAINPPPPSHPVSGRNLCDFSSSVRQNQTTVVGLSVTSV